MKSFRVWVTTVTGAARWAVCLTVLSASFGRTFASEPPSPAAYGVRLEQAWIPLKDGIRLAATLYLPDGAKAGEKFPALLEYLPYRKDDGTAAGDYPKHAYFARRGYVSVRVDIRGLARVRAYRRNANIPSGSRLTASRSSLGWHTRAGRTEA